jgi:transketolase
MYELIINLSEWSQHKMISIKYPKLTAGSIRQLVKQMIIESGGGHAGGSLSIAEILETLFGYILFHNPNNPKESNRDRFILSKGHSSLSLYATLALCGYFDISLLNSFGKEGSPLMNHPDRKTLPGIEMSTGSLGHGLSLASGMAITAKMNNKNWKVFTILGDGECHEGSVWEAAMFSSHHNLNNLIAIIDRNKIGNDGFVDEEVTLEPFVEKWQAFGWDVKECNGHDVKELFSILDKRYNTQSNKPFALIANTIKGKGLISKVADSYLSHYIRGTTSEINNIFINE